jgi:hypothetical protein
MKQPSIKMILAAALFSPVISVCAAADDPLTGSLTKGQIEAITMTTVARVAGSGNRCPRFHVIERALFQELHDADIPPAMLETQEYKNAVTMALFGVVERMNADQSDWCLAVWQLFGPQGRYRRQMLEAN